MDDVAPVKIRHAKRPRSPSLVGQCGLITVTRYFQEMVSRCVNAEDTEAQDTKEPEDDDETEAEESEESEETEAEEVAETDDEETEVEEDYKPAKKQKRRNSL